jgi:6-phosphogluconolactonase
MALFSKVWSRALALCRTERSLLHPVEPNPKSPRAFDRSGAPRASSTTITVAMAHLSRRSFLGNACAAALAGALPLRASPNRERVFIASGSADGILAYDWDPATASLNATGVAAHISTIDWLAPFSFSPDKNYIFVASEVDEFQGKPTGAVASFALDNGSLRQISAQNSAGKGTCHVAVDHSGRMLLAADYGGGSAASFKVSASGVLSEAVWTEHYTVHGPNKDRQESAHAHFCSFSPDNRFAYINDLGGDMIHIYRSDAATAMLSAAGAYHARPGAGPRTLHFHPNGHTAYSVNELDSTVDVLAWHKADGQLTLVTRIDLLPADYHGPTRACDTVISRDGRFVYFANRDNDFLYSFRADPQTGALTPMARSNCGGKTPRNFTLDPTEHWMLVANQDSNLISVFARNPETGELAGKGKSFAAQAPMCILFA